MKKKVNRKVQGVPHSQAAANPRHQEEEKDKTHFLNTSAATWQNQQNEYAPSEDSDQPGHPPSLIRVFAVRMKKPWVLSYPLSAQGRLWSDWADAQLIWVFAERTLILLVLSCHSSLTNTKISSKLSVTTWEIFRFPRSPFFGSPSSVTNINWPTSVHLKNNTVKILKLGTPKNCCNYPKTWPRWLYYRGMCPKGADWMANSVDPH